MQSDMTNASKRSEIAVNDPNIGQYPRSRAEMVAAGIQFSEGSYKAAVWCQNPSGTIWALAADNKDGKSYYVSSTTKSMTEFSGPVQGKSGGVTCPNIGLTGAGWVWLLQTPNGAWYP